MNKINIIDVKLPNNRSYPVYVGYNILDQFAAVFKQYQMGNRVIIITNKRVYGLYAKTIERLMIDQGYFVKVILMPEGETNKNLTEISKVLDQLLALKVERKDTVIGIGGGIVGDMAGFIASMTLRGINLVHIPTTLLAQSDSAVGGKTGVNHQIGKNLIGAFYQPKFTFIDTSVLSTLADNEFRCGLAEVVKYGISLKPSLFKYINDNKASIYANNQYTRDPEILNRLITASVESKADLVAKDELEGGIRAILNFGHTIGHAIEAAYHYKVFLHGEAVAIGMKAAIVISQKMGLITKEVQDKVFAQLSALGFTLQIENKSIDDIYDRLYSDKKVRDNKLRFILPTGIGQSTIRDDVPEQIIKEAIGAIIK